MANPVLGKSLCSDWFYLGQDFALRTVSMETVQSVASLLWSKTSKFKICNENSEKKSVKIVILHIDYQQKLKRLKFFRNFKDG